MLIPPAPVVLASMLDSSTRAVDPALVVAHACMLSFANVHEG